MAVKKVDGSIQNRKKIGLDIDGTLALFHETLVVEYNRRSNTNHSINDITGWSKRRIPISDNEFFEMHD